jgi:hypothetical protein
LCDADEDDTVADNVHRGDFPDDNPSASSDECSMGIALKYIGELLSKTSSLHPPTTVAPVDYQFADAVACPQLLRGNAASVLSLHDGNLLTTVVLRVAAAGGTLPRVRLCLPYTLPCVVDIVSQCPMYTVNLVGSSWVSKPNAVEQSRFPFTDLMLTFSSMPLSPDNETQVTVCSRDIKVISAIAQADHLGALTTISGDALREPIGAILAVSDLKQLKLTVTAEVTHA